LGLGWCPSWWCLDEGREGEEEEGRTKQGRGGKTAGRKEGGKEGGREGGREEGKKTHARTDLVPPQRVLVVAVHGLMKIKDDMGPVRDEEATLVVDLLILELLQLGHELWDVYHLRRGERELGGMEGEKEGGREEWEETREGERDERKHGTEEGWREGGKKGKDERYVPRHCLSRRRPWDSRYPRAPGEICI